jgi:hypothetical protein
MSTSRQETAPNVEAEWIVVMSRSRKRQIKLEAEMNREYYDQECSFCGSKLWDCGGDHGDEMRDILRESRRRRNSRW